MTLDIREAPEVFQVLYDALCEAFGEPEYKDHLIFWRIQEESTDHPTDQPHIIRTSYASPTWLYWGVWDNPYSGKEGRNWYGGDRQIPFCAEDIATFVERWKTATPWDKR